MTRLKIEVTANTDEADVDALLCIGSAITLSRTARDAWIDFNRNDAITAIVYAIKELESAKARIEAHTKETP